MHGVSVSTCSVFDPAEWSVEPGESSDRDGEQGAHLHPAGLSDLLVPKTIMLRAIVHVFFFAVSASLRPPLTGLPSRPAPRKILPSGMLVDLPIYRSPEKAPLLPSDP